MRKYILYNPLAGNEQGEAAAKRLAALYIGHELIYHDLTLIEDYSEFFSSLSKDDEVIICGGDGTLSRFADAIDGIEINNDIFYYAIGSGNDFLKDLNKPNGSEPFCINNYIKNLPTIYTHSGFSHKFINGVGSGLDGYICAVGDKLRRSRKKKINYTLLAIKAVLFSFKPRSATITFNGVEKHYSKVWLSPVMFGKFFGGGMMVAPSRTREQDTLSAVVVHNCGRFRLLTILPTVFKGNHIKFKNNIEIINTEEITIEYDSPSTLQIDGEPVENVKAYTARAYASKPVAVQ